MKSNKNIVPLWLTLAGAAEYTGLSQRTIENYINDGLIISANVIRPGATRGRRLVERPSLDAYIEKFIGGKCEIAMNSGRKRQI